MSIASDECCSLYRLGLCPECAERMDQEEAEESYSKWDDIEFEMDRERRLGIE